MVDLLLLTSLDQLIFIYKISFTFVKKQATLMRQLYFSHFVVPTFAVYLVTAGQYLEACMLWKK